MNIPKEVYVIFIKENPYENMSQGGVFISKKLKNFNLFFFPPLDLV